MQTIPCTPVRRAVPTSLRKVGMVLTHLEHGRESVFRVLREPACRVALMRPVSSAYEAWRGTAPLSPKFSGWIKGWPVVTTLLPGLQVGPQEGLEHWDAERGVTGLLTRDPEYVELASEVLEDNAGCLLDLSGGATALIVAEHRFSSAVEIGEPVLLVGSSRQTETHS
jgi:hypothetical protein